MIITPSAPIRSASRDSSTHSSVHSAPVPISTGTRPRTSLTTVSVTSWRSSRVSDRNSPVLPSGMRPWMPFWIWNSTSRRSAGTSTRSPPAVNGVMSTV